MYVCRIGGLIAVCVSVYVGVPLGGVLPCDVCSWCDHARRSCTPARNKMEDFTRCVTILVLSSTVRDHCVYHVYTRNYFCMALGAKYIKS